MTKMLVCDYDGTLFGGGSQSIQRFNQFLEHNPQILFVVATGRSLSSITEALVQEGFAKPSAIISDVGTQIFSNTHSEIGTSWTKVVKQNWRRSMIVEALRQLPFVQMSSSEHQSDFKVTCEGKLTDTQLEQISRSLSERGLAYDLTYSHQWYLDVTPKGVNKSSAIEHLASALGYALNNVMVAGDSANDLSMLRLEAANGIVVANYHRELEPLKAEKSVYFSTHSYVDGVIDGASYWGKKK